MNREMKIYFMEYKDAFRKIDGAFSLEVLKLALFPENLIAFGTDGIRKIWYNARLRGRGYGRAGKSVGIKDGTDTGKVAVKWFIVKIMGDWMNGFLR